MVGGDRRSGWIRGEIVAEDVALCDNSTAQGAIDEEDFPFPDGSTLVKEVYGGDQELMALDVMSKRDGAWYWLGTADDGQTVRLHEGDLIEGDVAMCSGCHGGTAPSPPTDSVFLAEYGL